MAKNITINGASFSDVPSILIPLVSGGGYATFIDKDDAGGGGLPSGIKALKFGTIDITTAFTTTRQTFTHDLGEVPDFVMVWANENIATTNSMLFALRFNQLGYRSSAHDSYMAYHGNSTITVTLTNSNSTSFGVSNLTSTTFQLASSSASYYWRAGTYKWMAIKFS